MKNNRLKMRGILKKIKLIILLTITINLIVVFLIMISSCVSRECNPLSISKGFIQVFILDKDYYEIQEYPKIMIANKDMNLLDYMKNLGWEYVETTDENIHEFKYKDITAYVEVIDHKNHYIWKWRE